MNESPNAKMSVSKPDVRIRPLTALEDFEACVAIQRDVWGHRDLDITPVHQFRIAVHTGAILLGAFVDRRIVGYIYSFPADFGRTRGQHSHHLAVLPETQGLGLGKALKWAQRDEALNRGIELLTWTYDPMQARNANLNLHVLGVVGRKYLRNFYGETPALVLDQGVPSDRLLVEWWIKKSRVKSRLNGLPRPIDPDRWPKAVECSAGIVLPAAAPAPPRLRLDASRVLVEIPKSIRDLPKGTGLIADWQTAARRAFDAYFKRDYRLDDFIAGDRCYYVLKRDD
jgi:predicted GNAT superfamily acetyltransferase